MFLKWFDWFWEGLEGQMFPKCWHWHKGVGANHFFQCQHFWNIWPYNPSLRVKQGMVCVLAIKPPNGQLATYMYSDQIVQSLCNTVISFKVISIFYFQYYNIANHKVC